MPPTRTVNFFTVRVKFFTSYQMVTTQALLPEPSGNSRRFPSNLLKCAGSTRQGQVVKIFTTCPTQSGKGPAPQKDFSLAPQRFPAFLPSIPNFGTSHAK